MKTETFTDISFAYQLHYHFAFHTKYSKPAFITTQHQISLETTIKRTCEESSYHLLKVKIEPTVLYCLVSLRPTQAPSDAARALKSQCSREFNRTFQRSTNTLWAIGYFVRSVGRATREAAEKYIDSQGEHHGIQTSQRLTWKNSAGDTLKADHSTFDLSYHVVFVTEGRRSVFDSEVGRALISEVSPGGLGFYIEKIGLLPDHMHLLIRAVPSIYMSECVLLLMNRTLAFMTRRFSGVLIGSGAHCLWSQSAYVGSVGDVSTAVVKGFLHH
jgi:putative transposase